MPFSLFEPFPDFQFNKDECFLSGVKTFSPEEQIPVFPDWIRKRYGLDEKNFSMLGGHAVKYKELILPCCQNVIAIAISPLEHEIESAFTAGYESVKGIPELRLFQWMAKLMYGILYNDIVYGIRLQKAKGKEFSLSPFLTARFKNLHLMLQSLLIPLEYKPVNPWSIQVVQVKYSKDVFNYKDETNNLNFSLGMNDFGIIACLQDNGANNIYHKNVINKISGKPLHPIQFEELCARFIYSNYLLKNSAKYNLKLSGEGLIMEQAESSFTDKQSLFKPWDDDMYAQVLTNYWKPWGIIKNEIISFPNAPVSFLIDEYNNEFIEPAKIPLPS